MLVFILWRIKFLESKLRPVEEVTALEMSSKLNQILQATENLNERYVIGRGSQGIVYRVELPSGQVYALKRIPFSDEDTEKMRMIREIQTVGKVRHRNLVKLLEFWVRKECGFILYEYMPNGSLDDVLHEMKPPPLLGWDVRYRIAIGTAHGLSYLHHDCRPAIIHRDIKPRNILLDSDMEPRISDFGIARLLDMRSLSSNTSVHGTFGYMAPENGRLQLRSGVAGVDNEKEGINGFEFCRRDGHCQLGEVPCC